MRDGIINFANLGWVSILGGAYYAVTNFDNIPDQHRRKLIELYHRSKNYPLSFIVTVIWLVLRVLFALGWQLQLEMLMVIVVCQYGVRQIARARGLAAQELRRELTSSKNPSAVLGSHLPEWVTFPSANRVQWMNSVFVGLWPSIVAATDTSIRAVLEPLLEKHRPGYVKGFRIHSASIGSNPAVVNGVQHHVYGNSETMLDIDLSWTANMDIRILIRVLGPDVEVSVTDFEVKVRLRIVLGPHIPQWPCFANIGLSIVNQPEIDFNLIAANIPLDTVPGLSGFFDNFIRKTLVQLLTYPKAVVIPVVKGYEMKRGLGNGALGSLKVKFLRIDNVQKKYKKYKKTPFYCKLQMEGQGKRLRTKSYTGFDTPMDDVFPFTLYDNTSVLHVYFAIDVMGSDLHVGQCDITVKQLMETDLDEVELAIVKASDASHARRVSVYIKSEFNAFTTREQQDEAVVPPDTPPPRMSTAAFREEVTLAHPIAAPHSRAGSKRSSTLTLTVNSGTLFVHVESAHGLKNIEALGKSDPYVMLRIGPSMCKSSHVNNNLNPIFNYDGEVDVTNCESDVLLLRVIDKNVTSDKLMGELKMPVKRIAESASDRIGGTYPLLPQGTVTFSASFLRHT